MHTIRFTALFDRATHHTIENRCANAKAAGVLSSYNYSVQQAGMMTYEVRYG